MPIENSRIPSAVPGVWLTVTVFEEMTCLIGIEIVLQLRESNVTMIKTGRDLFISHLLSI